jgi:hypothetical protein
MWSAVVHKSVHGSREAPRQLPRWLAALLGRLSAVSASVSHVTCDDVVDPADAVRDSSSKKTRISGDSSAASGRPTRSPCSDVEPSMLAGRFYSPPSLVQFRDPSTAQPRRRGGSPKAGVAGSNPAGGTHFRRLVYVFSRSRDRSVSAERFRLILDTPLRSDDDLALQAFCRISEHQAARW